MNLSIISATEIQEDNHTYTIDDTHNELTKNSQNHITSEITEDSQNAIEEDKTNKLSKNLKTIAKEEDSEQVPDSEEPEHPDLIDNNYTYVYHYSIDNFFDDGVLKHEYQGKNLIFCGDFENKGQLIIDCNDVYIRGFNSNLKNTVFQLIGDNITLKDLNIDLNTPNNQNKGATILCQGNYLNLINLNINYVVPRDNQAYAILADGDTGGIENLKIINSTIYFEGHNDNADVYNCAVKLKLALNSLLENNTITTSLPLKNIKYEMGDATLDSNYVLTLGIEDSHDSIFNNNILISDVNKRTAVESPTLNCVMISQSNNVLVSNNSIYMTDFITREGIDNYLYGIDIHNLGDLKIINNKISIVTTGGKLSHGTAYPIQISGPATEINITENDLYTFSNGPNIGIYSQNAFGETRIHITNNKINVTGLAGTDSWALVTGIETQDTYSEILNNQIEVHSVSEVGLNDNIYAISYSQSLNEKHVSEIINNSAISDGLYSIYLLSSQDSHITGNTLISNNNNAVSGTSSYHMGSGYHEYNEFYDNYVIRAIDYYSSNNNIDIGSEIDIGNYNNLNIISNSISGQTQLNTNDNNPLIPGILNFNHITGDKFVTGFIGDYYDSPTQGDNNKTTKNSNSNNEISINNGVANNTDINGNNLKIASNSSSASNSIGKSNNPISGLLSSAGASKSSKQKVYELKNMDESADRIINQENFINLVAMIILVVLLLVIGYKRKNNNLN